MLLFLQVWPLEGDKIARAAHGEGRRQQGGGCNGWAGPSQAEENVWIFIHRPFPFMLWKCYSNGDGNGNNIWLWPSQSQAEENVRINFLPITVVFSCDGNGDSNELVVAFSSQGKHE